MHSSDHSIDHSAAHTGEPAAGPSPPCRRASRISVPGPRRNASRLLALPALLTLVFLTGCTVIRSPDNGAIDAWYFGLVGVATAGQLPEGDNRTEVLNVRSAGTWLDDGFGVGYRSHSEVRLPSHCQVVFLIENETEAERILDILQPLTSERNVCAF